MKYKEETNQMLQKTLWHPSFSDGITSSPTTKSSVNPNDHECFLPQRVGTSQGRDSTGGIRVLHFLKTTWGS